MALTVSFGGTSSVVRHNKKLDRRCTFCNCKITKKEPYVSSVIFPMGWVYENFTRLSLCFPCLPEDLWSKIHKKMCGEE